MLLDCGRHYFDVPFIKRLLDLMALYKLNRFHWHLTEDQVRPPCTQPADHLACDVHARLRMRPTGQGWQLALPSDRTTLVQHGSRAQ